MVGRGARMLGFAGLLPQAAALLALIVVGDRFELHVLVIGYAALILSFLGGIWWGFAMEHPAGQGIRAAIAVLPSLVALAIVLLWTGPVPFGWSAVLMGSSIAATLVVDRHLVREGDAPAGWMALRIPLSLGLAALTIAAGVVVALRPLS